MYVPTAFRVEDAAEIVALVRSVGIADLVTVATDGTPVATRLPILWDGEQRLVAHMARANPHWRSFDAGTRALVVVNGPDAYVSPSWYPAKSVHGKVVPTWNYTSVHFTGTVVVHDEADWVRGVVTALTDQHESSRAEPWAVTDAPADYLDAMLRAIVGIEVHVDSVQAKAKLSQNRADDDQRGVIVGLRAVEPHDPIARAMEGRLAATTNR
jgi:transcriptional regulator